MKIFENYSESIKNPSLIRLRPNLFVLSFHVMKLLPALHMLNRAIGENKLEEGGVVAETSSGSFAFGIALACTELNIPFVIVTDCRIDLLLKRQLLSQNGKVLIVKTPKDAGTVQLERLKKLEEVLNENPKSYWPCQYDNPENGRSYEKLGASIAESLGKDLTLVGPVGSGGSTSGLIKGIRTYDREAELVGVDTFNSVLFGMENGPRALGGLGNGILPKNLVHENYDEVHWVSAGEAFRSTHLLHNKYGIFAGPTTGAALKVALFKSEATPSKNVLFVSPDTGHRYFETVYNKRWIKKHSFLVEEEQKVPHLVEHPREASGSWSHLKWNKRSLSEILGSA